MKMIAWSEISTLLLSAFRDFGRLWGRFLLTDLFYKVLAFVVLTPIAGLILNLFIATSGNAVLADQEILYFLLRPVGLIGLTIMGAVTLGIVALEQACLMAIGFGEMSDRPMGAVDGIRLGVRAAKGIFVLTWKIVSRILLLAIPFIVVIGLLYRQLLTEFDINYYLTERPIEFKIVLGLAAMLIAVMGFLVVRRLIGWSLSLPILLFGRRSPDEALTESVDQVQGNRIVVGAVLIGWGLAAAILSTLPLGLVELVGGWIVPGVRHSMTGVTLAAGVLVVLFAIMNLVVSVVNASTLALLVLQIWSRETPVESDLPEIAELRGSLDRQPRYRFGAKTLAAVLTVAAIVSVAIGFVAVERVDLTDNVTITAHRGGAIYAPENTMAAIERGLADGADYIEIDVQEDADGRVVVLHDSDLMKIGGSELKIWNATAAELAQVDIGSWFDPEFSDQRVPSLREVLETCRGRAKVNIELKYYGHDRRLVESVVEEVENLGMESEIIVMSLKYDMVQKMKSIRPEWEVGLLTATAVGDLTKVDADFLAVNSGMAKTRFVRSAHAADKDVHVWTINDPLAMSVMMSRGVDSIITDDPGLARSVLEWRKELNLAERAILSLAYWFGISPPPPDLTTDPG